MKHSPPNSQCLPETRKEVLRDIRSWADSDSLDTSPHLLWIYGYAGCGKSAIAHEVAKIFAKEKRLAACFVFFRGSGDRSSAGRFAATVASQVASAIPETEHIIESTLRKNPSLLSNATASLSDQFDHLVLHPIRTSQPSIPFIVVLDGVDECRDHDEVSALIENVVQFFEQHPSTPVRFLITSRVEDHLHQVLHSSAQVQLLNLVEQTSDADIDAALTAAIQKEARGQVLSRHSSWPSPQDKARLVRHIGGSFIFMSTIVKRLFDRSSKDGLTPIERLPLVLSMNPDFDDLYKEILTPCQHIPHFYPVINVIALTLRPVSVAELADIIDIKTYEVANVLINMHAIIQVPGDDRMPVTLWHTSLRDYLTSEDRSGPFFANLSRHRWLALRCISLAGASNDPRYHPSSAYSQNLAFDHLVQVLKDSILEQDRESLVHGLRSVRKTLNLTVFQSSLYGRSHRASALEQACSGANWNIVNVLVHVGVNVNIRFLRELYN